PGWREDRVAQGAARPIYGWLEERELRHSRACPRRIGRASPLHRPDDPDSGGGSQERQARIRSPLSLQCAGPTGQALVYRVAKSQGRFKRSRCEHPQLISFCCGDDRESNRRAANQRAIERTRDDRARDRSILRKSGEAGEEVNGGCEKKWINKEGSKAGIRSW